MKEISTLAHRTALLMISTLVSCSATKPPEIIIPALEYSKRLKEQVTIESAQNNRVVTPNYTIDQAPTVTAVADTSRGQLRNAAALDPQLPPDGDTISNEFAPPSFETTESTMRDVRGYTGPLSLGDPGISASLWRESRGDNDIFRDQRAWRPMDLLTITITESAEGKKSADTETKSESTVEAGITQFFTLDDDLTKHNPGTIDPSQLISAATTNEFKGEGETNRKDTLKGTISAMVAEVLPSGILRIEGEKIISVNQEEQIMVISGLVRPRDINSRNEVDSAKIANMRIDYYGKGIVGEAQYGGWMGRLLRIIWPF